MSKAHIKLDLHDLSVAQQIAETRRIIAGLIAAGKTELAARLTTITDKYESEESAAQLKKKDYLAAVGTRQETGLVFLSENGEVATLVEQETGYNGPAMEAIGYALASTNRKSAEMTKVLNLQLSPGDHIGQLHAHWDPIRGSRSYQIQYLVSPTLNPDEGAWQNALPSTASKCDLDDLPSHQLIWVRVRAIGAGQGNIGAWSDAVSMSAQ